MTRKDAWTERELQVIYDLVNTVEWFDTARELLPSRTENAIRTKMSNLRAETGIVAGMIGPRAMSTREAQRDAARRASERLRQAMLGMAA